MHARPQNKESSAKFGRKEGGDEVGGKVGRGDEQSEAGGL